MSVGFPAKFRSSKLVWLESQEYKWEKGKQLLKSLDGKIGAFAIPSVSMFWHHLIIFPDA